MTPSTQAVLIIAMLIAVAATAIIVVPMLMSRMRGRQACQLVEQLNVASSEQVAGQPISEETLASLMHEYTPERYARLTADQQRDLLKLLGRKPASGSAAPGDNDSQRREIRQTTAQGSEGFAARS
jgi:hypothetical protein